MNLPMVQILLAWILSGFAGKSSSVCVCLFVYVQGFDISPFWSVLFGLLVKTNPTAISIIFS